MATVIGSGRHGRAGPAWTSRRRLVAPGLAALGLALLAWLLIGRLAGAEEVARAVGRADPRWLPLCLAGELVSYAGYVLAYRQTARVADGPDLPRRLAARVIVLGYAGTALASAPGGLAVDYWALHEAGASRDEAVRRVLALNTAKWLALAGGAALAGGVVLAGLAPGPSPTALAWVAAVVVCGALAAWVSAPARARRLAARPAPAASHRLRTRPRQAFAAAVGGVLYVRRLLAEPRRNAAALAGFALYWAGDVACLGAALHAFGAGLDPAALLLAYATGYAATALPLPLGGSGGVEVAMTYSLYAAGAALAPALLAVAAYRFFAFWLPLAPAAVTLPSLRRLEADLARVRERAGAR